MEMNLRKAHAVPANGLSSSDAPAHDCEQTSWARLRKYLTIGSIAVLSQSAAILMLATMERRRRHNQEVIRHLVQRINKAHEQEQRHIARELHDNIGQGLSLLSIRLGSLLNQRSSRTLSAVEIAGLIREVDDLISEIHNLSHDMHSSKLEYLGLEDALGEMCRDISRKQIVDTEFEFKGTPGALGAELSLCFYRIAQEALNNVVKHSYASRAKITLTRTEDRLMMQITDDGTGFDTRKALHGLGLASMEERINSVHGSMSVLSILNEGTSILVETPLPHSQHDSYESQESLLTEPR
jgi:signal transduction histidine kinase